MIINFGKHNGTDITKLPLDYLVWLQDYDKNPEGTIKNGVDWSQLAQQELIRRKSANYAHDLFSESGDEVVGNDKNSKESTEQA